MLLSIEQRKSEAQRLVCELFYILCDELADITYNESLRLIVDAVLESVCAVFHITDEQIEEFTGNLISRLPKYLQISLGYMQNAA